MFTNTKIVQNTSSDHNAIYVDNKQEGDGENLKKLNKICLNSNWVKQNTKEEIKSFLEISEVTSYWNFWDITVAVLWGIFIAFQVYIKKKKKPKLTT